MTITNPLQPVAPGLRVLVTGHTGFKGSWLSAWLLQQGARVSGIALPPESPDALFHALRLDERMDHAVSDIREARALTAAVQRADPEVVFHLAAQALVRRSYREPVLTWHTNVIGTLNVLEAARSLARPVIVVAVTSDKVYKNREWEFAYREEDELGGQDPYSASKAACELAVASWRTSFGSASAVTVMTARAGNVLGGGDVSDDRIVPDCFRAWRRGETVQLRYPHSTRPWQHVLEPLSGYLALAAHARAGRPPIDTCNFGPGADGTRTVEELVRALAALGSTRRWAPTEAPTEHEARALSLCVDRARYRLEWIPRLSFEQTIAWTNAGYMVGSDALSSVIERQIADYHARVALPSSASSSPDALRPGDGRPLHPDLQKTP
jgi:CDP-glucose 4,6-dehydratase